MKRRIYSEYSSHKDNESKWKKRSNWKNESKWKNKSNWNNESYGHTSGNENKGSSGGSYRSHRNNKSHWNNTYGNNDSYRSKAINETAWNIQTELKDNEFSLRKAHSHQDKEYTTNRNSIIVSRPNYSDNSMEHASKTVKNFESDSYRKETYTNRYYSTFSRNKSTDTWNSRNFSIDTGHPQIHASHNDNVFEKRNYTNKDHTNSKLKYENIDNANRNTKYENRSGIYTNGSKINSTHEHPNKGVPKLSQSRKSVELNLKDYQSSEKFRRLHQLGKSHVSSSELLSTSMDSNSFTKEIQNKRKLVQKYSNEDYFHGRTSRMENRALRNDIPSPQSMALKVTSNYNMTPADRMKSNIHQAKRFDDSQIEDQIDNLRELRHSSRISYIHESDEIQRFGSDSTPRSEHSRIYSNDVIFPSEKSHTSSQKYESISHRTRQHIENRDSPTNKHQYNENKNPIISSLQRKEDPRKLYYTENRDRVRHNIHKSNVFPSYRQSDAMIYRNIDIQSESKTAPQYENFSSSDTDFNSRYSQKRLIGVPHSVEQPYERIDSHKDSISSTYKVQRDEIRSSNGNYNFERSSEGQFSRNIPHHLEYLLPGHCAPLILESESAVIIAKAENYDIYTSLMYGFWSFQDEKLNIAIEQISSQRPTYILFQNLISGNLYGVARIISPYNAKNLIPNHTLRTFGLGSFDISWRCVRDIQIEKVRNMIVTYQNQKYSLENCVNGSFLHPQYTTSVIYLFSSKDPCSSIFDIWGNLQGIGSTSKTSQIFENNPKDITHSTSRKKKVFYTNELDYIELKEKNESMSIIHDNLGVKIDKDDEIHSPSAPVTLNNNHSAQHTFKDDQEKKISNPTNRDMLLTAIESFKTSNIFDGVSILVDFDKVEVEEELMKTIIESHGGTLATVTDHTSWRNVTHYITTEEHYQNPSTRGRLRTAKSKDHVTFVSIRWIVTCLLGKLRVDSTYFLLKENDDNDVDDNSSIVSNSEGINTPTSGDPDELVPTSKLKPFPFSRIKKNQYIGTTKSIIKRRTSEVHNCYCLPHTKLSMDFQNERGDECCGEFCENRLSNFECIMDDYHGECQNKRFQQKKWIKTKVIATPKKGFGLFARESLNVGDFVMEYVGEIIDDEELEARKSQYAKEGRPHYYFISLEQNMTIDATVKGCNARFINHSCDPNCETQKWTVGRTSVIGIFAIRDIKKNEELTFDYGFERFGGVGQKCYCGSDNCRGFIQAKKKNRDAKQKTRRKNLKYAFSQVVDRMLVLEKPSKLDYDDLKEEGREPFLWRNLEKGFKRVQAQIKVIEEQLTVDLRKEEEEEQEIQNLQTSLQLTYIQARKLYRQMKDDNSERKNNDLLNENSKPRKSEEVKLKENKSSKREENTKSNHVSGDAMNTKRLKKNSKKVKQESINGENTSRRKGTFDKQSKKRKLYDNTELKPKKRQKKE